MADRFSPGIIRDEWIWTDAYQCSNCEHVFAVLNPTGSDVDFCPFCGTRNWGPAFDSVVEGSEEDE